MQSVNWGGNQCKNLESMLKLQSCFLLSDDPETKAYGPESFYASVLAPICTYHPFTNQSY